MRGRETMIMARAFAYIPLKRNGQPTKANIAKFEARFGSLRKRGHLLDFQDVGETVTQFREIFDRVDKQEEHPGDTFNAYMELFGERKYTYYCEGSKCNAEVNGGKEGVPDGLLRGLNWTMVRVANKTTGGYPPWSIWLEDLLR
jgi:hypothetical protein